MAQTTGERSSLIVECMKEQGVAAVATADGGIESHGDGFAHMTAYDTCKKSLIDSGRLAPTTPPTREFFEGLYAYNLTLVECLQAQGYEMSQPPTIETFVDSYMDPESETAWAPYDDIAALRLGQSAWDEINRLCPQDYLPY